MADVEILFVPPSAIDAVWEKSLELLQEPIAMTRGCYEAEDVYNFLAAGKMGLWLAIEGEDVLAAYAVELVFYPRKTRLRATFAGGKPHTMERWLPQMEAALEQEARRFGGSGIEAIGRKGWAKMLDSDQVGVFLCRDFPKDLH
jgi:hypothetical protein